MWSNTPVKITRKTTGAIYIPAPSAPIVGGTQPGVLARLRGDGIDAEADDGWVPRFCLAWPDADIPEWSEARLSPDALAAAQAVFAGLRLYRAMPHVVTLSVDAYHEWKRWHAENRQVQRAATGLARQWAAKAPFHLARLTLTLHALATVTHDRSEVSAATLRDAIALIEYFRAHLVRILPAFGAFAHPNLSAALETRVARILASPDAGWIARADLHRSLGGSVKTDDLSRALQRLERRGLVEARTMPTGARPREEWRAVRGDQPHDNAEHARFRRYEDMKNSPGADPNSSYLHIFDDTHQAQPPAAPLQETWL
jgi:hypothetical protein